MISNSCNNNQNNCNNDNNNNNNNEIWKGKQLSFPKSPRNYRKLNWSCT